MVVGIEMTRPFAISQIMNWNSFPFTQDLNFFTEKYMNF